MKIKNLFTALLAVFPMFGFSQQELWPALPKTGFISGKAATQADVDAGNAVFAAQVGSEIIGKPINITIPQYAYHLEKGKRIRVIIIQAEEAQGQKIIGAKIIAGGELVGLLNEFELLGIEGK